MTARNPILVYAGPGVVMLVMDVDTTVAVSDSVELGVASGGVSTHGRPLGMNDVEEIRKAAAKAAADADPDVPVLLTAAPPRPDLRIVGDPS